MKLELVGLASNQFPFAGNKAPNVNDIDLYMHNRALRAWVGIGRDVISHYGRITLHVNSLFGDIDRFKD